MLYLVNYKIINQIFDVTEMNHIVEAENEEEAIIKLEDYHSNPLHKINIQYCNEIIK